MVCTRSRINREKKRKVQSERQQQGHEEEKAG